MVPGGSAAFYLAGLVSELLRGWFNLHLNHPPGDLEERWADVGIGGHALQSELKDYLDTLHISQARRNIEIAMRQKPSLRVAPRPVDHTTMGTVRSPV